MSRLAARGAAVLFAGALAAGFAVSAVAVWRTEIPEWRRQLDERVATLQLFLATDDPSQFEGKPRRSLPHPRPELLVRVLRNPDIQRILPPSLGDTSKEIGPLSSRLVPLTRPVAAGACMLAGAVLLFVAALAPRRG